MTISIFLKLYAVALTSFMVIDLIWLGAIARSFYQSQLGHLMRADVNWVAAVGFYLIFVFGIVVLVVWPAIERESLGQALLLGGAGAHAGGGACHRAQLARVGRAQDGAAGVKGGGGAAAGIGSGFWWSAVTMTTVGYGDKAPITLGGRVVAFIWMLLAIIIVSVFTATITSTLTVAHLDVAVKGPQDLPKVRVGAIANTTGEPYLQDHRISYTSYDSALEGLGAIKEGYRASLLALDDERQILASWIDGVRV